MVVGSTTLAPGEATTMVVPFRMAPGMGGPHDFAFTVESNDAAEPRETVRVRAFAQEPD